MNVARWAAVLLVAAGLAGIAIALGCLYKDFTRREGARVDLLSRRAELTEVERRAILDAWKGPDNFIPALLAGSAGAAALGAGLLIAVFELPIMRRRSGTVPNG